MKKWNAKNLPVFVAGLGAAAAVLRWLMYAFLVDDRLLLPENHFLQWLVAGLSVAACVMVILSVRKLDGHPGYRKNFGPSLQAAMGMALAAVGIGVTVLTERTPSGGMFDLPWRVLGAAAAVCFCWMAYDRFRGKKPFFLCYVEVCIFLAIHMLNNYQYWSGNPQTMDFVFSLVGCVALMLFAYHQAAFCVGLGKRRMQLFFGLMAGFLCIAALSRTDYWYLYCGCGAWALTDLCRFTPVPKPQPKKESEAGDASA